MPAPSLSTAAVTSSVAGLDVSHDEPDFDGAKPSAVLAVLADGPHGAEVLLTRRSMDMTNHRGEVSFPGGRQEPGEDLPDTARREAWEEIRLDPAGFFFRSS